MRRLGLGLALAGLGAAATAGAAGAAPFEEPVAVTATTPSAVAAGAPFDLSVEVVADAGALGIAAQPLRLRLKFAPECGGSFAGTEGPVAVDRALPAPGAGSYAQTVNATPTLTALGPETVCAFVEDAQERQFATDTEATLTVVRTLPTCAATRRRLLGAKRSLRRLDHRIRVLRKRVRHASSTAKLAAEKRHLKKLRKRRRRLAHRKRSLVGEVAAGCGVSG